MTKGSLIKIFMRSFFIHATLNFRRMQNLGFAYAMIPFIQERKLPLKDEEALLTRSLQMFNTHPYLSAPLIGSMIRMEDDRQDGEDAAPILSVKQSLMGPYAAIGDTFFWGALRPCAGICAAALAYLGFIIAPLTFLLIFGPTHIWVRSRGFIEGYRRGKQGIEYIRKIDLLRIAVRVRWFSLVILSFCCVWLLQDGYSPFGVSYRLALVFAALTIILLCWLLIKKGVSQVNILYGAVLLLLIFSWRESLMWWL